MDAVRIDSSARLMAERDALLMRSGILREEQADAVFGIVNGEGKLGCLRQLPRMQPKVHCGGRKLPR